MLTLQEVVIGINERLINIAPGVKIQSNDIQEGYDAPSFFVELDAPRTAQFGSRGRERTIPVIIYYFPSDSHHKQLELLDMQEKLERGFAVHFEIKEGFIVFPMEFTATTTDGVLQASFELYTLEYDMTEDGDDMNELNFHIEKRD